MKRSPRNLMGVFGGCVALMGATLAISAAHARHDEVEFFLAIVTGASFGLAIN